MFLLFVFCLLVLILFLLVSFWYSQIVPQAFIHLMDKIPYPERGQRILVIAPHPDDESIAAGGYVTTALRRGAEVWVVLVTDGNRRGKFRRRIQEFSRACSVLGIPADHRIYWHYSDNSLRMKHQSEIRKGLNKIMSEIKPHIVISPHEKDTHRDHRVIGRAAEGLALRHKCIFYKYLIHFPYFPSPMRRKSEKYLLPPLRLMFENDWQVFYLSLLGQELKEEAIKEYRSQMHFPALDNLLFSFLRKNEMFSVIDYS